MNKIAIILMADNNNDEGLGRALHSIIYAQELSEKGNQVKLIFDGAGVKWITKFLEDEDNLATKAFSGLNIGIYSESVTKNVCKFCSEHFKVPESDLKKAGFEVVSDYHGHPDIGKLVEDGYRIVTL